MKNIFLFILIIIFIFISCSYNDREFINKNLIDSISKESSKLPSKFITIMFFCRCDDNTVMPLNIYELREIYLTEYSKLTYKSFLIKLLNQRITVKYNNNKRFKIDKIIEKSYQQVEFNEFIHLYCEIRNTKLYILRSCIPKNQWNSIFYYLFINNFQTSFDDYEGTFRIHKI